MKQYLDPHKEIFKWGPTPFYIYYADCFDVFFIDYPEEFPGYGWPDFLALFKENRMVWMHEADALQRNGEKLFLEMMLPREKRESVRAQWMVAHHDFTMLNQEIGATDLSLLSFEAFQDVLLRFGKLLKTFWVYAILPELSNYGSSDVLRRSLVPFVPEEQMMHVMEILTAPEGKSFYQEEEIDLVETDDITVHQQKYFWLRNSYANVEVLPVEFFAERKKLLSLDIRKEVEERLITVRQQKIETQEEYKLPDSVMAIAEAITDAIVWQDTRKKDIWIYLHYKHILLVEAAQRLPQFDVNTLLNCSGAEIIELLNGRAVAVDPNERKKAFGVYGSENTVQFLGSSETLDGWKLYVDVQVDASTENFSGIIACKGKGPVTGKVKIVLDPHNVVGFDDGDVLVTSMTTPEYVFIMKKASAVVTDTGGLTSHAAIVSRELGVPCIVGTKVATTILKDGDIVEVDASKGTIKVLTKA